ncbi:MAG TPA: glycerol-3-phosphate responsive antiterminator [Bacillales bacterium]|nr:glycerol-3-phosphate responsive antiterminator [Bacillales bacterium]
MAFYGQKILPAVRGMKDFEKLVESQYQYIVLLDTHVGQLRGIVKFAKAHGKKVFLHADLIQGLKTDEYAAEFLCQEIRPDGLISTRTNVVATARKKGLTAIQRLFLLDSIALDTSYKLLKKSQPDYIEVLPGVMPHIIREVKEAAGIPIFAGGLIRTAEDVEAALDAGSEAVTTSREGLWKHYAP